MGLCEELPVLHAAVCRHFLMARDRCYSPALVARLRDRVVRSHAQLYRTDQRLVARAVRFVATGFPEAVRREIRLTGISALALMVPALVFGILCYLQGDWIYTWLSVEEVAAFEAMYDPDSPVIGRDRQADTDFQMFAYYVRNNVGIGFRSYALGLLFGIGTVMVLLFNGLSLGGIAGYLTQGGYGGVFWPFVSSHSALELVAVVIFGAAGLRLGCAVLAPGAGGRGAALRDAGRRSVRLVIGATLMMLVAAFIEAFWSSSAGIAVEQKYLAGVVSWAAVLAYFGVLGRGRGRSPR